MSESSDYEQITNETSNEESHLNHKHQSCESLLSILHDKNKIIEKLQKQLHFQKLQLKFYLNKQLETTKVNELAKTCQAATEENILVNIALSRFCKKMGIKSKIMVLYERMCNMEGRVNTILQVQECVLRKILTKICDLVKSDETNLKLELKKMLSNPEYMDMFNNLMHANVALRKNLDVFRICCDRLIITEEERNMIVEQVYSLPIEQRTNCNYLIGIQVEKVQLQNRLKEIMKDQDLLRNRIEELHGAEDQLRKLQEEYKAAYRLNTENVTNMLRKVNQEALSLITKSTQQREKYTKEIVKLKSENKKISKVLEQVKNSLNNKQFDTETLKLGVVYSAGLFSALDNQITQAIKENEMEKDVELQKVRLEKDGIVGELNDLKHEKQYMLTEINALKQELVEIKEKWNLEVENFEKEREISKSQIEDLQAIRAAYAQLVDSRADLVNEKRLSQLNDIAQMEKQKFNDLQNDNNILNSEVERLNEELSKQKSKIFRLSQIIVKLNGASKQKVLDVIHYHESTDDYNKLRPKGKSTFSLKSGILSESCSCKSPLVIKNPVSTPLNDVTAALMYKISNASEISQNCQQTVSSMSNTHRNNCQIKNTVANSTLTSPLNSITNCSKNNADHNKIATTFEIQTSHRNGKKDTIKGVLEGRDKIEGTLNLGDTSMLSVKVKCVSETPEKIGFKSLNAINENKIDDYELMKDCSMETVAYTVPPLRRLPPYEVMGDVEDYDSDTGKNRTLKVTYKNYSGYQTITDFSSTDQCYSQTSSFDNRKSISSPTKQPNLKLINILDPQDMPSMQSNCGCTSN